MNRVTAYVALLGGFVAALALYLIDPLREPAIAQQVDPENWPICTSMAASDGPAWAPLDPDFAAGKRALAAKDWEGAIRALESAALRDTRNADLQNYLGYAYGRLRHFENAVRHYEQALTLNARHRGAHQHLGETYLVVGDLVKAAEHLAELERICLIPCQEHDTLKRAIGEYKKTAAAH
jgi:tetratricopeptide (TPR) repeat protein